MQQPAPGSRTVFRACVVNAVREGESLMQQLVTVTRGALATQESELRDIARRNLASDALRLLNQHEAALLKGYPMALLEVFADGPEPARTTKADATGLDFGELSLVDDDEVQAQVELSRAQQLAVHATEAVLSELNGLVSAAQGLRRVHPERNPLRPENYIRALQQVIADTGVASPIREAWMQPMRTQLGSLLVDVYKRAAQSLRDQGVQPVGLELRRGLQRATAQRDAAPMAMPTPPRAASGGALPVAMAAAMAAVQAMARPPDTAARDGPRPIPAWGGWLPRRRRPCLPSASCARCWPEGAIPLSRCARRCRWLQPAWQGGAEVRRHPIPRRARPSAAITHP